MLPGQPRERVGWRGGLGRDDRLRPARGPARGQGATRAGPSISPARSRDRRGGACHRRRRDPGVGAACPSAWNEPGNGRGPQSWSSKAACRKRMTRCPGGGARRPAPVRPGAGPHRHRGRERIPEQFRRRGREGRRGAEPTLAAIDAALGDWVTHHPESSGRVERVEGPAARCHPGHGDDRRIGRGGRAGLGMEDGFKTGSTTVGLDGSPLSRSCTPSRCLDRVNASDGASTHRVRSEWQSRSRRYASCGLGRAPRLTRWCGDGPAARIGYFAHVARTRPEVPRRWGRLGRVRPPIPSHDPRVVRQVGPAIIGRGRRGPGRPGQIADRHAQLPVRPVPELLRVAQDRDAARLE